jgi:hypothetical protein
MLTTKEPNKISRIIINACRHHAENTLNEKVSISQLKISKYPSLKFIFFLINFILSGGIFDKKKRLDLTYSNVNIGRFILSSVFDDFETYLSRSKFYFNYLKSFYIAGKLIKTANNIIKIKNFKSIYIDHCGGLNGILFTIISKKKIVYTNNYPKNIFATKKNLSKFNGTYEGRFKNTKSNKYNSIKYQKRAKKILKHLAINPKIIPWMYDTKYNKIDDASMLKEYEYIIYTHSFTDGQLWFGNDGFENSYDWLKFTLNNLELRNKKTLIKCHPNYFSKFSGRVVKVGEWDKKVFNLIYEKYKSNKNFYFMDKPIKNGDLIKKLNKNCIGVTHHGSVILEMGYLGFKVISSTSTFYSKKFQLSNIWSNKDEYNRLLNKKSSNLKECNKKDLYEVINKIYFDKDSYSVFNKSSYTAENSIEKMIKKHLNKNYSKKLIKNNRLDFDSSYFNKLDQLTIDKIAKSLAKNIIF